MLKKLWVLALLCSTGSILVVLGTILKVHAILQLIMLLCGLILCTIGIFALIKSLLDEKSK